MDESDGWIFTFPAGRSSILPETGNGMGGRKMANTGWVVGVLGTALLWAVPLWAQDSSDPGSREAQKSGIISKLKTMRITVNWEDTSLKEAIDYLREFTGVNFLIHPSVDPEGTTVTLNLKGVRVVTVLRLILKPNDLGAVYENGMIVIKERSMVGQHVVTRVYDVRDLFVKVANFPGPRLELLPGRGAGGAPGVSFTLEEPAEPKLDETTLEDIIKTVTGWSVWDDNEYALMQFTPNRMLVVAQTPNVHKEIERAIQLLRWFR